MVTFLYALRACAAFPAGQPLIRRNDPLVGSKNQMRFIPYVVQIASVDPNEILSWIICNNTQVCEMVVNRPVRPDIDGILDHSREI